MAEPTPTVTDTETLTPTVDIESTPTPADTPVVIVNEEEVIIPPDTAQVVTLEQTPRIRITEIVNMLLAVVGLVAIGLMFYRRYYTKPLHLIYVATWFAHYLLFAIASILNLLGLLTAAYSDVSFVRWGVLLNSHMLIVGAVTVVVAYIEGSKKPRGY
jgi:hypothetical protein